MPCCDITIRTIKWNKEIDELQMIKPGFGHKLFWIPSRRIWSNLQNMNWIGIRAMLVFCSASDPVTKIRNNTWNVVTQFGKRLRTCSCNSKNFIVLGHRLSSVSSFNAIDWNPIRRSAITNSVSSIIPPAWQRQTNSKTHDICECSKSVNFCYCDPISLSHSNYRQGRFNYFFSIELPVS